ncbi:MAG: YceI family protein [Phycisphaerales bacterium]|nr:YceI family protein [Phycisphaerales bacterium]
MSMLIRLSLAVSISLGALLSSLTLASAQFEVATWQVDSVHSAVVFRVKHGPGAFWGRFNDVQGTARFNAQDLSTLSLKIDVPVKGVDSGNADLDRHLRSADFFNETEFPLLQFTSTSIEKTGDQRYALSGMLNMLGQKQAVKASLDFLGTATTRRGTKAGLEATFTIKRSDFGMDYGLKSGLGDEVRLIVALELARSDDAPADETDG